MTLPPGHPLIDGRTADAPLVRAFLGESAAARAARAGAAPSTPVWFMRQAGRSLPEYRERRAGIAMLDSCLDPGVASDLTLQPVHRHGVDAAIFFSDIVIPLLLAGVDVQIVPGTGPVLGSPVRTAEDVARLPVLDPAALAPIADGVARTVAALGGTPLIGFAGAPFTLATYLVEGGPSKDQLRARTLMHAEPETWAALMTWAAGVSGAFLRAQVLAGASAAQLFDSWAGALSLADYEAHAAPFSAMALAAVRDLAVPIVHFGTNSGELLVAMRDVGADVIGVDHRTRLDEANRRLGGSTVLQGNIDPALLGAPWPVLEAHVRDVLRRGAEAPAHVLNLGHGVPPSTDPDVLSRIVRLAHGEL